MTPASIRALEVLRSGSLFQWYVIPLFALVVYVYAVEVERRNLSLVLAGLTVSGIDWSLEIANALFLKLTGYAAVWTEVGPTAYQIFVGLNIETFFMFAIMGIVFGKMLPPKDVRILGFPNRPFLVVANSLFCVLVEVVLNRLGYLVWAYSWWNLPNVSLIVIVGYSLYFVGAYYVIDVPETSRKVRVPAIIWAANVVATVVLVAAGWI